MAKYTVVLIGFTTVILLYCLFTGLLSIDKAHGLLVMDLFLKNKTKQLRFRENWAKYTKIPGQIAPIARSLPYPNRISWIIPPWKVEGPYLGLKGIVPPKQDEIIQIKKKLGQTKGNSKPITKLLLEAFVK